MSDLDMRTTIAIDSAILSPDVFPRTSLDEATVERYAAAMLDGAEFPPIEIKSGTRVVLDGWHRVQACRSAGIGDIAYVEVAVPDGIDDRLYAASRASRHGLPLADTDARQIARDIYDGDPEVSVTKVARLLGRPRQTVEGWLSDQIESRRAAAEHQREVRRVMARMLSELGWMGKDIAAHLGVTKQAVSQSINADVGIDLPLDESVLRDAVAQAPDAARHDMEDLAERWREERIFATWTDDERALLDDLRNGQTVVVNMRGDAHARLWAWAEQSGLAVRIDRKSVWGNPFVLPDDGTREKVIYNYRVHYLPHKPKLLHTAGELRGKALGCWCAPAACHGDVLRNLAEQL